MKDITKEWKYASAQLGTLYWRPADDSGKIEDWPFGEK
jgi:hypothetical protein